MKNLHEILEDARASAPQMGEPGKVVPFGSASEAYQKWADETFKTVSVSPSFQHPGINGEDVLHRFMDLPKLLDLLVNHRILLPSLAALKKCDPRECADMPDYSQVTRTELQRKAIQMREFAPENEQGDDLPFDYRGFRSTRLPYEERIGKLATPELHQAVWFLEHARLSRELVCGCWYGSAMESDAMWKLYCDRVGVSVTTTVSRLKSAVKCNVPSLFANHITFNLARITYAETAPRDHTPWLFKRNAFRHEDEVRLYLEYPFVRPPGFYLSVDPWSLIKKITVTPYAEKWHSKVIEDTIRKLLRPSSLRRSNLQEKILVQQSAHLDASAPNWPKDPTLSYFDAFATNG